MLRHGKKRYFMVGGKKKLTFTAANERNVQDDSCTAYARDRFIHQEANAATRVTLIQSFQHDRNFPRRSASGDRSHAICRSSNHSRTRGQTSVTRDARGHSRINTCFIIFRLTENARFRICPRYPLTRHRLIPGWQKWSLNSSRRKFVTGRVKSPSR